MRNPPLQQHALRLGSFTGLAADPGVDSLLTAATVPARSVALLHHRRNQPWRRHYRSDAQKAGLIPQASLTSKRVDFHCLRKSCADILIEIGVHPKTLQQVLRHSDIRLTMDLYGELGEDDLFRDMANKFPVPYFASFV